MMAIDCMYTDKEKVAKILSHLLNEEAENILNDIASRDPKLAVQIKELMFRFEDIENLHPKDVEKLHQKLSQDDLVLALKGTSAALAAKLLMGVSYRRRKHIVEQMQLLGKVKRSDVDAAKAKIASVLQTMVESGELSLNDQWIE